MMDDKDFTRIRVGQFDIGILGLKKLVEQMAATHAGKSDEEVASFMVRELSSHNYIPDGAKDEYGKGFLREFRKSFGQEQSETSDDGLEIKVLGMGCAQCDSLEQTVMGLLTELEFPASLDHITDIREIAQYGVMGSPALVINGKVVAAGRVPSRNQIKAWLIEANGSAACK
jgi:small redox-active disulfide protein 2